MATLIPVCKISIPQTHRDCFDYHIHQERPCIGTRVWVPFGHSKRLGLVVAYGECDNASIKLKSILEIIDPTPCISTELLNLCQWISRYYQAPLSEVLALALPKKYRAGDKQTLPQRTSYHLTSALEDIHYPKGAPRQRQLLEFIATHPTKNTPHALREAGFTRALCQKLCAQGLLRAQTDVDKPEAHSLHTQAPLALNDEQAHAVHTIKGALSSYHCFLLYGITGSGKTEVYLHVMEQVFAAGRQVLVLVPEIGLTPQLLDRFRARFSVPMAVLHSHLNDTERQVAWQFAAQNDVQLVIGTRSAIFTPMPHLGLIVIDEEHDASFKQMEGVRYSARDTALMRAHMRHIPIILGSATPSLETLHNCTVNKYQVLRLHHKALTSTPLHMELVDLRNQTMQHGIAPRTLTTIQKHLEQNNQVLVFINRRGFAPVILCHQCGWIADCHACDSHLTYHKTTHRLVCHHCGLSHAPLVQCPTCQSRELLPVGAGTQRVYAYLESQCPHISIARIDRDEVSRKHALNDQLNRIHTGDVQLIVGTQMLAKGHHFPRLSLVVVLDTDHGFYNQDFRALERLGQLLTQVAGRAGRAEHPGHVIIQTHIPQHPLLNMLIQHGYESFARTLLEQRQQAALPPYSFMAVLRAQDKHLPDLLSFLHHVKTYLETSSLRVLGPAPAPLARKAHQHRMQLLITSPVRAHLQQTLTALRAHLTTYKHKSSLRWNIDVDPLDLS